LARPNILIACTDQQRTDTLSCYGSTFTHTPGFDRVAERGTRYNRAYCPSAVCTPSRASMMSGQYTMRHGAWNVGVNTGDDVTFLSHRLADAGYETRLVGKAHFESYTADASRSRESVTGYRAGYGDWTGPYYGFQNVELALGHTVWGLSGHYGAWLRERWSEADIARLETLVPADKSPEFGGNAYDWDLPTSDHNSTWTADRAIAFLERERQADKPFFLFVSFQDPHHPHALPRDYRNRVDPAHVPLPSFAIGELDAMPPHFRVAHEGSLKGSAFARRWPVSGQHDGFDYRAVPEQAQRNGRAYYHSMVRLIDDQLVRLWATLDAQGLTDNTLVFVTSDHGELLGDHGLWMKGPFHYEQLAKVPFLAMGPGIGTGRVEDSLVSLIDIAPTCLKAAGVAYDPSDIDGIDITTAARGADETVLCETILDWEGMICRSVIGRRYKLTWYANWPYGELFDLEADAGETRNLWSDPGHAQVRADLLGALVNHDTRMQASPKERIAYA
jgi:arylsulfatase A-like enzyme